MKTFKAPCFFIGLAILLSIFAVVFWVVGSREIDDQKTALDEQGQVANDGGDEPVDPNMGDGELNPKPPVIEQPFSLESSNPEELVNRVAKAFEDESIEDFSRLLGSDAVDAKTREQLRLLAQKYPNMRKPSRIREVGETELNKRTRWALEFDGDDGETDRVYLDLKRGEDGKWILDKVSVPTGDPDEATRDALGAAEAFLQAVLSQKFEESRKYVDSSSVSDARIAGLCILFEEGHYHMRQDKPLRAMFQRKNVMGYLANVEAADGTQAAQFSLLLSEQEAAGKWLVTEINLDRLLADYAERVAGGDVYYSPLVKNPEGGDTLALYFEFDEDEINPRTRKQLDIVARLLKTDTQKKLTLSGHTDAKGTEDYNDPLSMRRAKVVRDYLIEAGVDAEQVVTVAKGSRQPRRPNVTETGDDNPEGRRANRRTEIYLDF